MTSGKHSGLHCIAEANERVFLWKSIKDLALFFVEIFPTDTLFLKAVRLSPLSAFKNKFNSIFILEAHPSPHPCNLWVRRRRMCSDLNRRSLILSHSIGNRVERMLPHVSEASPVVVPVSTVHASEARWMEWFQRRGPAIHIPIKIIRHGLRLDSHRSGPLPYLEPSTMHHSNLFPIDQSGPHNLSHVVLPARCPKAPISSDLKNALCPAGGLYHRSPFSEKPRHRFFTYNILPCLHRRDGDERMPVGRGRDRDHVQIIAFQQPAKIRVARLVIRSANPLDVAAGYFPDRQLMLALEPPKGPRPPASCSDQGRSESLTGRCVFRPTKHMGRNNLKYTGSGRFFYKRASISPDGPRLYCFLF